MNDYDLRQLTKMRQQIDSYRSGGIGLNVLIADLIFLRDALTAVNTEWERGFTNCIVNFESAYSYAIEKNSGKLDEMTRKIVDDTIPMLLDLTRKMGSS
ncbi:MAG: hypothetical protein Q8Q54_14855 [Methylococcales bacterium]|nr:hypothetical protein [Methylococcales bacterium]MDP3840196.1 hypothetical protein [Methylococcales bacterium]